MKKHDIKWVKINTENDLPPENKYVIAKHNRGTWFDDDDQENVNTVVVKLVRGISKKERESMRGTDRDYQYSEPKDYGAYAFSGLRSDVYMIGDENGNNKAAWEWRSFGADTFFGQCITHWMHIPPIK